MVNSIQLNFLSKAQDIFLSINNITHTRRFVHAFLTGKFYSVKISVTFFVTESPSFHHQMMEIPIDMMEIDNYFIVFASELSNARISGFANTFARSSGSTSSATVALLFSCCTCICGSRFFFS